MSQQDNLSPFIIVKKLLSKQTINLTKDEFEKLNMFIIMRYLSSDIRLFEAVNAVNNNLYTNEQKIYFLNILIDKENPSKRYNLKFIKASNLPEDDFLKNVMNFFDLSQRDALPICVNMASDKKEQFMQHFLKFNSKK